MKPKFSRIVVGSHEFRQLANVDNLVRDILERKLTVYVRSPLPHFHGYHIPGNRTEVLYIFQKLPKVCNG
jgi:hypothetical protein